MYLSKYTGAAETFYCLYISNIACHVVGVILLAHVHRYGRRSVHNLLLINVSVTNVVKSLMNILRLSTDITLFPNIVSNNGSYEKVVTINAFALSLFYTFGFIFVTIDRLGLVLFTSSYFTYWSCAKSFCFLLGVWMFGVLECSLVYVTHRDNLQKNNVIFDSFIKTTSDFGFVFLALVLYVIILYKYGKTRKCFRYSTKPRHNQERILTFIDKSDFYVSIILISIYFLLDKVPESILLVLHICKRDGSEKLTLSFLFLSAIADTMVALVYIILRDDVRNVLVTKLKHTLCCRHRRRLRFDFTDDDVVWPDFNGNQYSNPIIDRILELSTQV